MSLTDGQAWTGHEAEIPDGRDLAIFERELALVDRIIGLEAEVAQLSSESSLRPDEQLGVEQQLERLRGTVTWRTGRLLSAPLRVVQRAAGRQPR